MVKVSEEKLRSLPVTIQRVLKYNPDKLYRRLDKENALDPFKRQHSVSMKILFPAIEGECACGCGAKLEGRQKKWSSSNCQSFAHWIFAIISGYAGHLRKIRKHITGDYRCEECGEKPDYEPVDLDHIVAVKNGGGGGWLSNYQFKCKPCHKKKTKVDLKQKKAK